MVHLSRESDIKKEYLSEALFVFEPNGAFAVPGSGRTAVIQNVRISIEKRWNIMGVDRSRVKISRSSFENHHAGDHEQKGAAAFQCPLA